MKILPIRLDDELGVGLSRLKPSLSGEPLRPLW